MLVITAHQQDQVAYALVSRWATSDASLLTCTDLSTSGWRYYQGSPANSRAIVSGQEVAIESITGVLNRLTCVFEPELAGIIARDRSYAADLTCPVLNHATSTGLAGPYWPPERWIAMAARIGIPVRPVQRRAAFPASRFPERSGAEARLISATSETSVPVTIVGKRCFGAVDETLARQARLLAEMASVELLTVHFSGPERGACFLRADLRPDISADSEVEQAVLAYLQGNE